jgi:NlpC/P60 family
MGFRLYCGHLLLAGSVLMAGAPSRALGQSNRAKGRPRVSTVRLQDQGLAILGAALESGRDLPQTDCSHAVHAIYQQAGLPYPYATSRELYAGAAPFKRVTRPLPGDLVVWPGHVGIVVNPRNHSFYSALTSGVGVEDYDSDYWRKRGQRRFFRYAGSKAAGRGTPLAASIKPVSQAGGRVFPSLVPSEGAAEGQDQSPPVAAASLFADPASSGPISDLPIAGTHIPSIRASRPTANQIQEAILQAFRQNEDLLEGRNLLKAAHAVVIFDEFEVHKIHIKGNQAWVEVRISEPASLVAGKVDGKKRSEKLRWPLTRAGSGWQVRLPLDTVYVARQTAPRILSHQLATLTERSDVDSLAEQAQLAHALDVILQ